MAKSSKSSQASKSFKLVTEEIGGSTNNDQAGVNSLDETEPTSGTVNEGQEPQEESVVDYETSGIKMQREKRRMEREAEKAAIRQAKLDWKVRIEKQIDEAANAVVSLDEAYDKAQKEGASKEELAKLELEKQDAVALYESLVIEKAKKGKIEPGAIVYPSLAQDKVLKSIKHKERIDKAFMTNVPTQMRAGDAPITKEIFAELIGAAQDADRRGSNKQWRNAVNRLKLTQATYFQAWESWEDKEKFATRDANGKFVETTPPEPQGRANHGLSIWEVMHQKSLIQEGGTLEVEATKKKWTVSRIHGRDEDGKPYTIVEKGFREPLKLIPVDSKEDEMAGKAYQDNDPYWHEISISDTEGLDAVRSTQKWLEDSIKSRMAQEANIEMEIPEELQDVAISNLPNPWGPFDRSREGLKWWRAPKSELFCKLELKKLHVKVGMDEIYTFSVGNFGKEVKGTSEKPSADWIGDRGRLAWEQGWYSKKAVNKLIERNPMLAYNHNKLTWQLGLWEQGRFCGHYISRELYAGLVAQIYQAGRDIVARKADQGDDAVTNYLFQRMSLIQGSLKREKPIFTKKVFEGQQREYATEIHGHICFSCNSRGLDEDRFEMLTKVGFAQRVGKAQYVVTPHVRDEGNHVYLQEKLLGHKPRYKFSGWSGMWRCVFCGTMKPEKTIEVKIGTFLRPDSDDYWVAQFEVSGPILKQLLWAINGHDAVSVADPYAHRRPKGQTQHATKYVPGSSKRSFAGEID